MPLGYDVISFKCAHLSQCQPANSLNHFDEKRDVRCFVCSDTWPLNAITLVFMTFHKVITQLWCAATKWKEVTNAFFIRERKKMIFTICFFSPDFCSLHLQFYIHSFFRWHSFTRCKTSINWIAFVERECNTFWYHVMDQFDGCHNLEQSQQCCDDTSTLLS